MANGNTAVVVSDCIDRRNKLLLAKAGALLALRVKSSGLYYPNFLGLTYRSRTAGVATHETRIALLDQLTEWYIDELQTIDRAFDRIKDDSYGVCLACHNPIEPLRLDCFPDAAFCSACQETRDGLQNS